MVQQKLGDWRDLRNGAVLQTLEAASLGLPFEVWKTRMGKFRNEGHFESLRNIYVQRGLAGYWAGFLPKAVESATKGAVLMFAKSAFDDFFTSRGISATPSALLAGALGGVAQVSILGPCTFLVTGAVTGSGNVSVFQQVSSVYRAKGISGFYAGGLPVAYRQATNWASREGFTVAIRQSMRKHLHNGDMSGSRWRFSNRTFVFRDFR
jgi:hypothetical protein